MARTNYKFAKRQREIAKKKKKEEKLKRKIEKSQGPEEATTEEGEEPDGVIEAP